MFGNLSKHGWYYVSLFLILAIGFALAYARSSDKEFQIEVVVFTSFLYVIWGILHHILNHDLNLKIVVEYILIGSLGLVSILFLLKSGGI